MRNADILYREERVADDEYYGVFSESRCHIEIIFFAPAAADMEEEINSFAAKISAEKCIPFALQDKTDEKSRKRHKSQHGQGDGEHACRHDERDAPVNYRDDIFCYEDEI